MMRIIVIVVLACAAGLIGPAGAGSANGPDLPPAAEFEQWRARAQSEGFANLEESLLAKIDRSDAAALDAIHLYAAHGLWPEALALIRERGGENPDLALLAAAAKYQMGRWDDVVADLDGEAMRAVPAAALWRGLANVRRGAEEAAAADLLDGAAAPNAIADVAEQFYLAQADLALRRGELARARRALDALRARPLDAERRAERSFCEARLMAALGKNAAARALFDDLAGAAPQPTASLAGLERLKAELADGEIDRPAALLELERLSLAWRGGSFEREALAYKAALLDRTGDVAGGFTARRRIIAAFPASDAAAAARGRMTGNLTTLFEKPHLTALQAAEIFYENIDAAPPGAAGDALIRGAAERLIALDLLKEAAELLRHQVFNRLRGPSRSETAAELAGIYLADGRARDAVQTLRATRLARLPAALNDRRRWLEARALVETKDGDAALQLLSGDDSAEAAAIRGDIYWRRKEWTMAGAAYADALTASADAQPLTGDAAATALKSASAFVLAGEAEGLRDLLARIDGRLADPDLRALFAMLAAGDIAGDPARFFASYQNYFGAAAGGS